MGHITAKSFEDLQKRLDMSTQGAPRSETLFKILEVLFSKEEAKLASKLPLNFFTVEEAMKLFKKSYEDTKKILDDLADKAILVDTAKGKTKAYVMVPTMAGFIEFSLMRTDGKFDSKLLSELYYQYINIEKDFMEQIFNLKPAICRTFIHEDMIQEKDQSEILDYERATKAVESAYFHSVGRCYCRHKMEHMNKACTAEQMVCLSFNDAAKSLAKHGVAKEITKDESLEILNRCIKNGLVQIGDNVQDKVAWICNCCGCCCEALLAYKNLGYNNKINTNFYAKVIEDTCIGCTICAQKCPVNAIKMEDKIPVINFERCIGCGVCTRYCKTKSLVMEKRPERKFVPKDYFERYVLTAIEEGKLQNFIFENQTLWTHKVMRKFLGFFLKMTPTKRLLVQNEMQSRFLNSFLKAYFKFNKESYPVMPDYSHPEMNIVTNK